MDTNDNMFYCDGENKPILNPNRIKLGEVYKIQNDEYSLVCVHCPAEFQYFSEFVLHVEDHLKSLNPEYSKLTLYDTETVEVKVKDEINIDLQSNEEIGNDANCVYVESYQSHDPNIKLEKNDAIVKTNNTEDYFKRIESVDFVDYTCNETIIPFPSNAENKPTKRKAIKEAVAPLKTGKKKKVTKHPDKYKNNRLDAPEAGDENREEYDTFLMEMATFIFAIDLIDTDESRLLSKYSLSNYPYERNGYSDYLCPICKAPFKKPGFVRRHIFLHASQKYFRCCLCNSIDRFATAYNLQSHIRHFHKNDSISFECFVCHTAFPCNKTLRKHLRSHNNDQNQIIQCITCHQTFNQLRRYQLHIEAMHLTSRECYLCKMNFRTADTLSKHFKLIHVKHLRKLCTICGREFSSNTALFSHMEIHENGKLRPYKCTICENKTFRTRYAFMQHNRTLHKIYASSNRSPVCDVCGESFENNRLLSHHNMRKHPMKNHLCAMCGKAFSAASLLKQHMYCHAKEKYFKCEACKKGFSNSSNLRRHRKLHCLK